MNLILAIFNKNIGLLQHHFGLLEEVWVCHPPVVDLVEVYTQGFLMLRCFGSVMFHPFCGRVLIKENPKTLTFAL